MSKLGVREAAGGGEEKESACSAQPKTRTPHKDVGKNPSSL